MSVEQERAIARKYIGIFPWFMVIWGVAGVALWLALFPLVHLGYLPLWAGFTLSLLVQAYCYLPSHEAEHGNIGRPSARWRWLNEFIGHTSMFPIRTPYKLHRAIHLKHHAYTNDDQKDPDIGMRADTVWAAAFQSWRTRQPDSLGGLTPEVLDDNEEKDQLIWEGFLMTRLWWLCLLLLCWTGFALEALMLWWLPMQIAMIYTQITLSWAPHYPMREQGRYRDTRVWKSPVGTVLSSGIGKALAIALGERGARVICADRDLPGAIETAATIGSTAQALECDLSIPGAAAQLVEQSYDMDGRLDLVCSNAGIGHRGRVVAQEMTDSKSLSKLFEVNLYAALKIAQTYLQLLERGGQQGRLMVTASENSLSVPQAVNKGSSQR